MYWLPVDFRLFEEASKAIYIGKLEQAMMLGFNTDVINQE